MVPGGWYPMYLLFFNALSTPKSKKITTYYESCASEQAALPKTLPCGEIVVGLITSEVDLDESDDHHIPRMCSADVYTSRLERRGLADQLYSLKNEFPPGANLIRNNDGLDENVKARFLEYSAAIICLDASATRPFEDDYTYYADMLDPMIKSCAAKDFLNPNFGNEILDENAEADRCTERKNSNRFIHYLLSTQFCTQDRRMHIYRALGECIEPLLAQFYTKDSWHEIKVKTDHPRYRILAERARLLKTTRSSCIDLEEKSQTLLRFSLHQSCIKVPSRDQFTFVFSLKSKDENTLLCLVRTVAYMFSDDSSCEKNGAKTIQDCYEWATDMQNDVKKLTTKYQGRKLPVLKCLRYAMIKPNAIVEIYNEKMKNQFQEGILHNDNYECESYGRIKFESLPEFVKM